MPMHRSHRSQGTLGDIITGICLKVGGFDPSAKKSACYLNQSSWLKQNLTPSFNMSQALDLPNFHPTQFILFAARGPVLCPGQLQRRLRTE